MRLSDAFLEQLRANTDIESVISPYVNLRRRGKNLVGLCPFHNEKTPSFTVYPENGSFYCFGCGVGGDVITFVRRMENLDYMEAVKQLADRAGMALPEDGYDAPPFLRRTERRQNFSMRSSIPSRADGHWIISSTAVLLPKLSVISAWVLLRTIGAR